jgi:predicted RNA-binding Zn ribbon-like protein
VQALRFDAGTLALNLIATLGRRPVEPLERMNTAQRCREWLNEVGLRTTKLPTDQLRADLILLREAMFEVLVSTLENRPCPASSVQLVREAAREPTPAPVLRVTPGGEVVVSQPVLTWPQVQSLIARDLLTTLADRALAGRIRRCQSEVCGMYFLDSDRGRSRQWCSMRRCGNSAKAARYRSRQAHVRSDRGERLKGASR